MARYGAVAAIMVLALISPVHGAAPELTPEESKAAIAEFDRMKREKPEEYRQTLATLQMALGAFGFGTGPFDGVLDTRTR